MLNVRRKAKKRQRLQFQNHPSKNSWLGNQLHKPHSLNAAFYFWRINWEQQKQLCLAVNLSAESHVHMMTNYIEVKISAISDKDFKILFLELCQCVQLDEGEFENKSLANFFSDVVREKREMDLLQVATNQILAKKVKELHLDSIVHAVCSQLVNRNYAKGFCMDDFAGKTVFTLIKRCYKAVNPAPSRIKKPSRLALAHQLKTDLIRRGRKSGSYH